MPRRLRSRLPNGTMYFGSGSGQHGVSRNACKWAKTLLDGYVGGGCSGPVPVVDTLVASQALGLTPAPGLDNLVQYRGDALRAIPAGKLKRGGALGYLCNAGSPWEFNVFAYGASERNALHAFAEAYGGDYVMLVTWGEALMIERIASPGPGMAPTVDASWSVRLVPLVAGRDPGVLTRLRRLFDGAAVQPDFATIERELGAPRISVAGFFKAFGIAGAREIQPPDAGALWAQLDEVAAALLAGEAPPKPALAAVNAVLAESGDKLPGKPARPGKGATASALVNACHVFSERLPEPTSGAWAERKHAADTVVRVEDSPARRGMTFGRDAKGVGDSAAAARMLAHIEPPPRAGDPMALALLSNQCEAWNWHGFVEPLAKLAETLGQTGFTAIVAPSDERSAMREAFGLEAPEEREGDAPAGPWAAEVFLDSPTLVKGDLGAAAAAWLRKRKCAGTVARITADGDASITYFAGGREVPHAADAGLPQADLDALRDARAAFNPRAVPIALGVGDLFAPGDLTPSMQLLPAVEHATREAASGLLTALPALTPVRDWRTLTDRFDGELRLRGCDGAQGDALLVLRIRVPHAEPAGLRSLRNDLTGRDLADQGDVWWHREDELRADMGDDYYPALLQLILGDAPPGTELALTGGREPPLSVVLCDPSKVEVPPCDAIQVGECAHT
ncbi:hypothetical protein ACFFGH_16085 [Lysobacter korlensis]|uniref:Uncharacterized protein n=1 Tax=Lysobacter korlensis TaxID=553636 RepID=A0ABV6RQV0_9GAMM